MGNGGLSRDVGIEKLLVDFALKEEVITLQDFQELVQDDHWVLKEETFVVLGLCLLCGSTHQNLEDAVHVYDSEDGLIRACHSPLLSFAFGALVCIVGLHHQLFQQDQRQELHFWRLRLVAYSLL